MSLARLERHRQIWAAKRALEVVYRPWFDHLLRGVPHGARVLEIGAGPGFLAAHATLRRPDLAWIASDLLATPWNDLAADATRLPIADDALDAIVGLDVLHHLAQPRTFFEGAARALRGPGTLALIEPWITVGSWPLYRFLHQERCHLGVDPWHPFEGPKDSFDGECALPWRMVRSTNPSQWRALAFEVPTVTPLNAFGYVLTLGFRRLSLLPHALAPAAVALDRWMGPLAPLAALRAMITWRKADTASSATRLR